MDPHITLEAATAEAARFWGERSRQGSIRERTEELYVRQLGAFARFAAAHDVTDVADVTSDLCDWWIHAPISAASPGSRSRAGAPPKPATRRNRQVVIRGALALWHDRGWIEAGFNPGGVIRPAAMAARCPLTPPEVAQLRLAGRLSPRDTLRPAVAEAALAGASQAEIAHLVAADLDAKAATLRLPGRRQSTPRTVPLTPHAIQVFQARIKHLRREAKQRHLPYDPTTAPLGTKLPRSHYKAICLSPTVANNLYRALRAAALGRPGVRPSSLQEYAANRCYALTNRVEDLAQLLGFRSLDSASRFIDPAWQDAWAEAIREHPDR